MVLNPGSSSHYPYGENLHRVCTIDTIHFLWAHTALQTILHNIPTIDARRFPYEKVPHWGYGLWRCADGRRVIFDREYHPLIQILSAGTIEPANPTEWVENIVEQSWFYCGLPPVERPAIIRRELKKLGIPAAFIGLALEGAPAPRRQD